jgi:hypothetical protein
MVVPLLLVACQPRVPGDALRLDQQSLQRRQLQTRTYATGDEKRVLSACAGLMQDMGFNIDASKTELGIPVGSKQKSAVKASQVIGSILAAALTGQSSPVDKTQKMRACIVTRPLGENADRKGLCARLSPPCRISASS